MSDQDWEALFDKYITEVVDDEQEHIKSHELPTAIKIRSLVSDSATQAAANKAAEEGGLPALPDLPRPIVVNSIFGSLFDSFKMHQYAVAYADMAIAADRASRQVAIKAEVDLCNLQVWKGQEIVESPSLDEAEFVLLCDVEELFDATPPATTGASTVLTDERIKELWDETDVISGKPFTVAFARAIEREVAAQAGQVALPGWVSTDDRLPENGKDVIILYWPYDNHENERVAGTAHHVEGTFYDEDGNDMHPPSHWMPFVIPAAAPSPAKESK